MWYRFSNNFDNLIDDDVPFDIYELSELSDQFEESIINRVIPLISKNRHILGDAIVDNFHFFVNLFKSNREMIKDVKSVVIERDEIISEENFEDTAELYDATERYNINNTEKLFLEFNKIKTNIMAIIDKAINAMPDSMAKSQLLMIKELFGGM